MDKIVLLPEVKSADLQRISTGHDQLDKIMGGGMVRRSATLLAGMPGAGKSTLLLQIASKVSLQGLKILYVAGEENPEFIRSRADRLGVLPETLAITNQDDVNRVKDIWVGYDPDVVFVDSLQTLYDSNKKNPRGKGVQNHAVLSHIREVAEKTNTAVIIVGQTTKTGSIAGGNDIIHDVDVVMRFDYWKNTGERSVYAEKNRFGDVDTVWDVKMTEEGVIGIEETYELELDIKPIDWGSFAKFSAFILFIIYWVT